MRLRQPTKWEKKFGPMHEADRRGIVPLDQFGVPPIPDLSPEFETTPLRQTEVNDH